MPNEVHHVIARQNVAVSCCRGPMGHVSVYVSIATRSQAQRIISDMLPHVLALQVAMVKTEEELMRELL